MLKKVPASMKLAELLLDLPRPHCHPLLDRAEGADVGKGLKQWGSDNLALGVGLSGSIGNQIIQA
jgi:hypothetical protein